MNTRLLRLGGKLISLWTRSRLGSFAASLFLDSYTLNIMFSARVAAVASHLSENYPHGLLKDEVVIVAGASQVSHVYPDLRQKTRWQGDRSRHCTPVRERGREGRRLRPRRRSVLSSESS